MWTHQPSIKAENAHILAVVDMVPSHYGVSVVFYPYAGKGIATDFIVLVVALCTVRDDEANVLTVTNLTMTYNRFCTGSTHTHCCTH